MTPALERQLRGALAYALLGALVLMLLGLTVWPAYSARRDFFERLATAQAAFARFSTAARAAAAARADIEAGRFSAVDAHDYFVADTNELAAAELQNRLKQMIEERHGALSSMTQRTGDTAAIFPPIGANATLRCSIAALVDLVRVIEAAKPVLFIDELDVQSLHQPGRVLPSLDVELDVRIGVTGYRFVPGGERS